MKAKNLGTKKPPQPIRFDSSEDDLIRKLANDSGLSLAEVVRRICRFALPEFVSGKRNLMKFGRSPVK